MAGSFNAYQKWLGIPPKDQPPNHYRLLGIELFESDPDIICNAADRQMTHVRTFATGQHAAQSQEILNAIARARVCLLDPAKKAAYDRALRAEVSQPGPLPAAQPVAKVPPPRPAPMATPVAPAPEDEIGFPAPTVVRPAIRKRRRRAPSGQWIAVLVLVGLALVVVMAILASGPRVGENGKRPPDSAAASPDQPSPTPPEAAKEKPLKPPRPPGREPPTAQDDPDAKKRPSAPSVATGPNPLVAVEDSYSIGRDETLWADIRWSVLAEAGFNDAEGIHSNPTPGSPYPLGQPIAGHGDGEPGWQGPWGAGAGVVQDLVVHEGDLAARLDPGGACYRQTRSPQTGLLLVEQYVRTAPGAVLLGLCERGDSTESVDQGPYWLWKNGTFQVGDGTGDANRVPFETTDFAWTPDQWYQVRVVIDVAAQTWDFYVDGRRYLAPDPLGFRGTLRSIRKIRYENKGSGPVYVDHVTLCVPDQSAPGGVVANDRYPPGNPLGATVVDGPSHGRLHLLSNGAFQYIPDAAFTGTDTFTYKLSNFDGESNVATVTINVKATAEADRVAVKPVSEGAVRGTVFEDADADGTQDPNENGLEGWTVQLQRVDGAVKPLHDFFNPDPGEGDYFGRSFAVAGDKILIGAPCDDVGAKDAGAAYLYDGKTFQLLHRFDNPDPDPGDRFGYAVAASAEGFFIGTYPADERGQDPACVYLFDGDSYNVLRTFANPEPAKEGDFGASIAVDGHTLVVVAPNYQATSVGGKAYVFDTNTGDLRHALENPEPAAGDGFGEGIDIRGERLLIGARRDDHRATDSGSAYLFDARSGDLLHAFRNPTPAESDFFGIGVLVTRDDAIICAPGADARGKDSGAVYVFDVSTCRLRRALSAPSPSPGDAFGSGRAEVQHLVAIAAVGDDTGGTNAGAVFLVDPSTGEALSRFVKDYPSADDYFGYAVASLGGDVLVGAYRDDIGAKDAGAVYLFQGLPERIIAKTNSQGQYTFAGLEPGEYQVRLRVSQAASQTAPPEQGYTANLGADEAVDGCDFGVRQERKNEATGKAQE